VRECDLLQQNCPDGRLCAVAFDGTSYFTACTEPRGGGTAGDGCRAHGDCEWSYNCVFGTCASFCCPDNDEPCAEGELCLASFEYGRYSAKVCIELEACPPFVPGACDDAEPPGYCMLVTSRDAMLCVPPSPNPVPEGASCSALNECGDNQTCWPPATPNARCRYACSLSSSGLPPGEGGCPAEQSCFDYDLGIDDVGICIP
jgi:hypothetical protein